MIIAMFSNGGEEGGKWIPDWESKSHKFTLSTPLPQKHLRTKENNTKKMGFFMII